MRSSPERPCDDAGRLNAALGQAGGDAAKFLDGPADERWGSRGRRCGVF